MTTGTLPSPAARSGRAQVQRQIKLPLGKAVEIAYKNIRLRLSRSLLVTSGIVLALAFLMSILVTDAMTNGMRGWAGSETARLTAEREALQARLSASEAKIRNNRGTESATAGGAQSFDSRQRFGADLATLQKELGVTLPVPTADVERAMARDPRLVNDVAAWVETARALKQNREALAGPQQLESEMEANGVPTQPEEIAANKTQTRWLLGLALLVAFVGILNAMLMSVTERFREIGTMKCLGALDGFIVKLFLLESLFQGIVGTVIGIVVGLLLSLFATWSAYHEFTWKQFPAASILAGAAVCLAVGVGLTVAAAVYPAWQAARMQPIDAMRVEA